MTDCRDCIYYMSGDYETGEGPECREPRIGQIMGYQKNWNWQGCKRLEKIDYSWIEQYYRNDAKGQVPISREVD